MNTLSNHPGALPRTVVTGATSGIGRELALQLAAAGVPVVAIGRDAGRLHELASRSPLIDTVAADLADTGGLVQLAAALRAKHPDIGCLVNNAGVQNDVRVDDAGQGAAQVRGEVDINLVAPIVLTQLLLPQLLSVRGAMVVNVTSSLAYCPKRTAAVYAATKAGLRMFTDALRVQMAAQALHVAEVVLPLVDTPMTAGRGRGKVPAAQAAREIIAGMQRREPRISVGKAGLLLVLVRWWPGMAARILQRD